MIDVRDNGMKHVMCEVLFQVRRDFATIYYDRKKTDFRKDLSLPWILGMQLIQFFTTIICNAKQYLLR